MYIMLMSQAHSVCNRHWDLMMRQTVPLLRRHLWFSSQCWLTVKLCETHKAAFSKPAWNVQLFSVACKKKKGKKKRPTVCIYWNALWSFVALTEWETIKELFGSTWSQTAIKMVKLFSTGEASQFGLSGGLRIFQKTFLLVSLGFII